LDETVWLTGSFSLDRGTRGPTSSAASPCSSYFRVLYRHHCLFSPLGSSLSLFVAARSTARDEKMASAAVPTEAILEKKSSHSASINNEMQCQRDAEELVVDSAFEGESSRRHSFVRVVGLVGLALLILGWWISSITLQATRHRWVVQTIFAWAFILIIAFRFIPNSVTRPFEAVWVSLVQEPFFRIPKYMRFALGWLSVIAIALGSAFGFKLEEVRYCASRRRCALPHLLIYPSGNAICGSRHFHLGSRRVPV
jgi:hypothetical protein